MAGSRKGRGNVEADKNVSNDESPVNCNDMNDAQHNESDVHTSPFRDSSALSLPKFEPLYFDGNPSDYPRFIEEFKVSQTTPQFVQKKRFTVSVYSSDSISFQGITSQSKGVEPLRICEEEPKSPTAVIKEFEIDEVDQIDDGKLNICDNDHDTSHLSLVDHDEMRGMPTTAELNKGSVQLEREVEINTGAMVEGMDTCVIISVNDQRVAHLSSDVNAKLELIIKDSSGGNLSVRQNSQSRTTTASDAPLSSSTCVTQSLVLSSTMKETSMISSALCYEYASIGLFEKTKVN
ncbi:unnamed protein product, partial [Trichobilharzia regenti]